MRNGHHSLLLADGGYGSEEFLATPPRQTSRTRTAAEERYQQVHISTRNVVERLFGQWKMRFPCLWIGMNFRNLNTVQATIIATAVLHNMCKMYVDSQPPELSESEERLYNLAREQEMRLQQNVIINGGQRLPATIRNNLLKNYFENIIAQQ